MERRITPKKLELNVAHKNLLGRRDAISSFRDKGLQWEEDWAAMVGGTIQPGSGNQWHSKLDVRTKKITFSCKWTSKESFSVTKSLIDEAKSATMAPGGDGKIPALAIRLPEEDLVIMRAQDFLDLMKEEPIIPADKADIRRAKARTTQLFREE